MSESIHNRILADNAFVALSILVDTDHSNSGSIADSQLSLDRLSALPGKRRQEIEVRLKQVKSSKPADQQQWFTDWKNRILKRGRGSMLDANVHAEQIAEVIRDESPSIQRVIEGNLPGLLAEKVAIVLQNSSLFSFAKMGNRKARELEIPESIVTLVRQRFLQQFVTRDQLITKREYDSFSMNQLGNLIWRLGLLEVEKIREAKLPRSGELLGKFNAAVAEEIAAIEIQRESVSRERAELAAKRVERAIDECERTDDRIRLIGLIVFASRIARREPDAARFSIQKLPLSVGAELEKLVRAPELLPTDLHREIDLEIEATSRGISKEFKR